MRLESIRTLSGPNIYIDRPVLCAQIELEEMTERESYDVPGFVEGLLAVLPGLYEHHCATGQPGGFVERLHTGTYFGHITEHVTIELAKTVGTGGNYGKTVYAGAPGRYEMFIECPNEAVTRFLVPVALDLVKAVIAGNQYPLEEKLEEARHIAAQTQLGPSAQAIVAAAERRGIPWRRLNEASLIQLGYGCKRRLMEAAVASTTSGIGIDIASDKDLSKRLLDAAIIPVPRGVVVRSLKEAVAALSQVRPPVVVKPLDGNHGRGVTTHVVNADDIAAAYQRAANISKSVVIEECFNGRDYRALVVGGKLVAVSERVPAHVVGDGLSNIAELISQENANAMRGNSHEAPLTRIEIDEFMLDFLQRSGRSLQDVPAIGEVVMVRETANLSSGGTARDVTDQIHPTTARLCERAARLVGLDICGLDLITPDIRQPLPPEGAGIIEVNAGPGLRMHHYPSEGAPRDAGGAIVDMLYPPGDDGRIPIVAITGTNGKTTVTRLISHILSNQDKVVGMTTTDGIWIGGHQIAEGDLSGPHSARTVLSDPLVEAAVLETARGGIVRRGLGYDWSDVAVMTNIQPDHLGQDGIETIDDLFFVKSLIAERVRAGGTLVLNAEDERLASLPSHTRMRKVPRQVTYFSLTAAHPVVRNHCRQGGTALYLEDEWFVVDHGGVRQPIARAADVPITMRGAAKFQIANVLAAVAACHALGMPADIAVAALKTFRSNENNHGRMNIFQVRHGYVVIDYGHNPGAFQALCTLAASWISRRVTAIFTAPGDRANEVICDLGRTAAHCFDRLIIREDEDLRGRRRGEVAELLCQAAKEERPDRECRIELNDVDALRVALEEMEEHDVIVFFYEKQTEPSLGILESYGARPVDYVEPIPRAEVQHGQTVRVPVRLADTHPVNEEITY